MVAHKEGELIVVCDQNDDCFDIDAKALASEIQGPMPTKLTLDDCGNFYTVEEFFDCNCDGKDMIKIKNPDAYATACPVCGMRDDEMPDSRLIEVLEDHPELNDVPWVMFNGTEADKVAVRAKMAEYLANLS